MACQLILITLLATASLFTAAVSATASTDFINIIFILIVDLVSDSLSVVGSLKLSRHLF